MATKFVGYKRKNGNFPNEKTGELVSYDNYYLYFITGGVPDIIGYYPSSYKINANVIRQILGLQAKDGDELVQGILFEMVNKDVMLSVLNVDDKPVVTSLALSPQQKVSNKQ